MLPIDHVLPDLARALVGRGVAVLQAAPGAGKTTRVPPALLDAAWVGHRKILMLEPRRIAAISAATWMARQLGEQVGGTVGYRVRRDTRTGPSTRIEIVTEGVLTRMLQRDPELEDVAIVILDEFHERSLHADLGLALTLQTRALLRHDLRVLVMSATLDGDRVATLLGGDVPAPVITSAGRTFPVEVSYAGRRREERIESQMARVIRRALGDHEGDVLAFLPGAGEIARVAQLLQEGGLPPEVYVAPLHGALDLRAQERAIAPSAGGRRKVVLATTIAQTSLTIEGVRVVVDCGLQRAPRFSPRTGMARLETVRISAASAEQRSGRAGRVAPGVCYRLWDAHEQQGLVPFDRPEILESDLAPLALELAAAGIRDPGELQWLDAPPAAGLAQGLELLAELGALSPEGRITSHGREIAAIPAHPRLAHMLVRARSIGTAEAATACDLAALLGQRDILRSAPGVQRIDADLRIRLDVLRGSAAGGPPGPLLQGAEVDPGATRAALAESRQWRRTLGIPADARVDAGVCGRALMLAYPDRVAQRRTESIGGVTRYLLRSGAGVDLTGSHGIAASPWLAVAELGGAGANARIFSAAPVEEADVVAEFAGQIVEETVVEWHRESRAVRARQRVRLGALVLREGPARDPDPAAVACALLEGIRQVGIDALPWTDSARALRARLAFAHRVDAGWPDVTDSALLGTLDDWLAPHGQGIAALDRIDPGAALLAMLDWRQRQRLDRFAPTHWEVPSGSRIRIDYSDPAAPVLAVRLQELFGLEETPRLAEGRVPLTIHLLSPAHRTVQVTQDLAGFWRGSYFEVRREMKGRYPKHYWPDDPLVAEPRRRTIKP